MTDAPFDDLLIEFLGRIPSLEGRTNRDILLRNLKGCPIATINRSDTAQSDLFRIVKDVRGWGLVNDRNKYALEILMENVRMLVKNTSLELELNTLKEKFDITTRREVNLPFAVVSMNSKQAIELDSRVMFPDDTMKEKFNKLLDSWGIHNLTHFYNDNGNLWKQIPGMGQDIRKIIYNLVDELNEEHKGALTISPKDISENFLSRNVNKKRQARLELEKSGGLVFIDVLSLFHPEIQHILQIQSKVLTQHNSVALVVISPIAKDALETQEFVKEQIYRQDFINDAFNYFENHLDPRYEFGIDEICKLRRWLFSNLPPENRRRGGLKVSYEEGLCKFVIGSELRA
jgi:hypothetical protein